MQEHLAARTIPGLHEAVLRVFARYVSPPANVLDLGAGTGAWAARLESLGYRVTAVERDDSAFIPKATPCIRADLNDDFSKLLQSKFSAVTAIEVIEHLENPWHFLRQCKQLFQEDGMLLLTTPNIECTAGRLRFLVTGNFRMFDRDDKVNDPTHITPIQTFMFEKMLRDVGLQVVFHGYNDPTPEISTPLSRLVCFLVGPLLSGIKGGDNHIFILRHA